VQHVPERVIVLEITGPANPVDQSASGRSVLVGREQLNQEEVFKLVLEQLRDREEVADQPRLQDDRHVRGLEQLDLLLVVHVAHPVRRERDLGLDALQLDHRQHYQHSA